MQYIMGKALVPQCIKHRIKKKSRKKKTQNQKEKQNYAIKQGQKM